MVAVTLTLPPVLAAAPPSAYMERFWFDTILHHGRALRYLADMVGIGRLVLGSDDPFPPMDRDPLAGLRGALSFKALDEVVQNTARVTTMVFMIFIGASMFTLTFNAYGGDAAVHGLLSELPGGAMGAMLVVMLAMFLLGFVIDFIEITFVVVPIVAPPLLMMGLDPVWLGVMMALNLQTSFLTPPFGFALFYLRGVAPASVPTTAIYRGALPFIAIQLLMLGLLALWPSLATWLPDRIYG